MSTWLNNAGVLAEAAPHEVSPTVQKGFGLGTTRGAMPQHHRTVKVKDIDFRELVYLMIGPF